MSSLLQTPLRFEPFLRAMPWGGRHLASLGKSLPTEGSYGESWEVSDHASHRSRLAEGPATITGASIRLLMEAHHNDLVGKTKQTVFPWLIKFLDAKGWLSVQVHPDDDKAPQLWPGESGKTEAWFVLAAEPASRIWAGLKRGVGLREARAALEEGSITECLHSFEPRPGQCLFLPAGTIHAVGGGVLLAEVQQTSDATFRLFDWNRRDAQGKPRTLHIEQGLAATDWSRGPVDPIDVEMFPGVDAKAWPGSLPHTRVALVSCPYFDLEYVQGTGDLTVGHAGRLTALTVLAGSGRFATGQACEGGQAWILPARLGDAALRAEYGIAMLVSTLP